MNVIIYGLVDNLQIKGQMYQYIHTIREEGNKIILEREDFMDIEVHKAAVVRFEIVGGYKYQ